MSERKIERIEYSTGFLRSFRRLPPAVKEKVKIREAIFRSDAFDSRLDTHKLHGKREGEWAYSIDYEYRIVFEFRNNSEVLYFDIGTHDELYR